MTITTNLLAGFIMPPVDPDAPYVAIYQVNQHIRTEKFSMFNSLAHFMISVEEKGAVPLATLCADVIVWQAEGVTVAGAHEEAGLQQSVGSPA